ncbi:MAG TPA: Smr/MutS family protein, partial [Gemmatimonadales bacterium]|nr:Smr/MutS family protein [Gemmatimonadales bacterium]
PRTTHHAPRASVDVVSEVSLRGLTVEEAEPLLIKAIDDAVLADLPYLRIIHGKGTGVLRDFVQSVLKRDPRIKRFALAPANQGGHGVTVAEFA